MRSACCTLVVLLLVGCQSQSAPISNPFMSPDRVPPPATRAILPGTAQPYYPGDPAPSLPAGGGVAPGISPGATYQTNPVTPTGPPGGWNTQPAPGGTSPYNVNPTNFEVPITPGTPGNEPAIRVQTDSENLRFVQTPRQQFPPDSFSAAPTQASPMVVPAQFQDDQPPNQESSMPAVRGEQSHLVPQPTQGTPRAVRIGPVNSSVSRDGFRPQGSRRKEQAAQKLLEERNSAPREFGPLREAVDRFGFDPQYQWLRGQLQYLAATNEWQLRYVPIQGQPDQFGGRVVIGNPQVLGELQPGSHVQVQGRLHLQQSATGQSVPAYIVSVVQRQR